MERRPRPNIKLHSTLGGWRDVNYRDWQSDMIIMYHESRPCLMHAIGYCKSLCVCKCIQCVYSRFCFCICDCLCTHKCACLFARVSVQDASGCLWYFTLPFRQRVSRLAANELITRSSIWCVLYGSLGSTISADESWERCGEWVGQLWEKMHRYASI